MLVLVLGANGFIGSRVARNLESLGHGVVRGVRELPAVPDGRRYERVDFAHDHEESVWRHRLSGIDVVLNAVGVFHESGAQGFEATHHHAPKALFAASAAQGVKRIVQISALGADEGAVSRFHRSKRDADAFLLGLAVSSVVAQPSLVYGPGGTSARWFNTLAALPWIPLPGDGAQAVQPIHIDDAAACLVRLVVSDDFQGRRVALVGPDALSLREYLAALRAGMGLPRARFMPVPNRLVRVVALAARHFPGSPLDPEALSMLARGNTADAADTRYLLSRDPRPARTFIAPGDASATRLRSKLNWLLPLLRASIAFTWLAAGLVSLGWYPVAESHALLQRAGVAESWSTLVLYGAALFDIALGIATLLARRRRWLWLAQLGLMLVYTAIITWRLPEFWLHPFGPVVKNIPLAVALILLHQLEDEPRRRSR